MGEEIQTDAGRKTEDDSKQAEKPKAKPTAEMNTRMSAVLKAKGNEICADCPAKRPLWVSFLSGRVENDRKLGVLICTQCAQYHHFELGSKRCLIKYLKMVHEFTLADIVILEVSGNRIVNTIFEANLTKEKFDKELVLENEDDEAERRSKFIKHKYKKCKYQDEVAYYQHMLQIIEAPQKEQAVETQNESESKVDSETNTESKPEAEKKDLDSRPDLPKGLSYREARRKKPSKQLRKSLSLNKINADGEVRTWQRMKIRRSKSSDQEDVLTGKERSSSKDRNERSSSKDKDRVPEKGNEHKDDRRSSGQDRSASKDKERIREKDMERSKNRHGRLSGKERSTSNDKDRIRDKDMERSKNRDRRHGLSKSHSLKADSSKDRRNAFMESQDLSGLVNSKDRRQDMSRAKSSPRMTSDKDRRSGLRSNHSYKHSSRSPGRSADKDRSGSLRASAPEQISEKDIFGDDSKKSSNSSSGKDRTGALRASAPQQFSENDILGDGSKNSLRDSSAKERGSDFRASAPENLTEKDILSDKFMQGYANKVGMTDRSVSRCMRDDKGESAKSTTDAPKKLRRSSSWNFEMFARSRKDKQVDLGSSAGNVFGNNSQSNFNPWKIQTTDDDEQDKIVSKNLKNPSGTTRSNSMCDSSNSNRVEKPDFKRSKTAGDSSSQRREKEDAKRRLRLHRSFSPSSKRSSKNRSDSPSRSRRGEKRDSEQKAREKGPEKEPNASTVTTWHRSGKKAAHTLKSERHGSARVNEDVQNLLDESDLSNLSLFKEMESGEKSNQRRTAHDSAPDFLCNLPSFKEGIDEDQKRNGRTKRGGRRKKSNNFHESAPIPALADMEGDAIKNEKHNLDSWLGGKSGSGDSRSNSPRSKKSTKDSFNKDRSFRSRKKTEGSEDKPEKERHKDLESPKSPRTRKGPSPSSRRGHGDRKLTRCLSAESLLEDKKQSTEDKSSERTEKNRRRNGLIRSSSAGSLLSKGADAKPGKEDDNANARNRSESPRTPRREGSSGRKKLTRCLSAESLMQSKGKFEDKEVGEPHPLLALDVNKAKHTMENDNRVTLAV